MSSNHVSETQTKKSATGNAALTTEISQEPEKSLNLPWTYALILGIAIKLGGCTISWNFALTSGFWEFFISVFVIGLGYINVGLCMSELISIISFAGGYYGYSRCALGPYWGYIVACCGIMESSFMYCLSVLKIGEFITTAFDTPYEIEPFWWFCIFNFTIGVHAMTSKYFWQWISGMGILCLCLVFIYLFGTMGYLNFKKYTEDEADVVFEDNVSSFFSNFRLGVLFFIGFDMITCTSTDIAEPRKTMPYAVLSLISFLFILSLWLVVTVPSQYPGITADLYDPPTYFPLQFGYQRMFDLSRSWALFLTVIPSIASLTAYNYAIGKQVNAMAKSNLLPQIFKYTYGEEDVPVLGMLYLEFLGFLGLLFAWADSTYVTSLSRFATLAACVNYLALFACYYVFATRYSNMDRTFRNPLGFVSCGFGAFIFALILFILIVLDTDQVLVTLLFLGYLALMSIYYYFYVEAHQVFSPTEQKVFFKAYVVNMKKRKKQTMASRAWDDLITFITGKFILNQIFPQADPPSTSSSGNDSHHNATTAKKNATHAHISTNHHNNKNASSNVIAVKESNHVSPKSSEVQHAENTASAAPGADSGIAGGVFHSKVSPLPPV